MSRIGNYSDYLTFRKKTRFRADEVICPSVSLHLQEAINQAKKSRDLFKKMEQIAAVNNVNFPPRTPQFPPNISGRIGVLSHHDSIGIPFDRQELITSINSKYRTRNAILPNMAERKFKRPSEPITGIRIGFIILILVIFLVISTLL